MSKIADLPSEVILLDEDELCIGPYHPRKGCGCLSYWVDEVFLKRLENVVDDTVYWRVLERVFEALNAELGFDTTFPFDEGEILPKEVCAGWNRAMAWLGYTVILDR